MPAYGLTQRDRDLLQEFLNKADNFIREPRILRALKDEPHRRYTPDVYVCRVPTAGIPALSLEVGTGTGVQDVPGSAVCQFYHLQPTGAGGSLELRRVPDLTQRVFNLSGETIPGNSWVLAVRAKSGHWYAADVAGEEGGTGTVGTGGGGGVPVCSGARVYHNANQSVTSATDTTLAFNSERYDTDNFHDTVTNNSRLTIPTSGEYAVGATMRVSLPSTGTVCRAWLRLNGTTDIAYQGLGVTTGAVDNVWITVHTHWDFTAGDYVEVVVRTSSGGSSTVVSASAYSPEFWIQSLCGGSGTVEGDLVVEGGLTTGPEEPVLIGGPIEIAPDQPTLIGGPIEIAPDQPTLIGGPIEIAPGQPTLIGGPITVAPGQPTLIGGPMEVAPGQPVLIGGPLEVAPDQPVLIGGPFEFGPDAVWLVNNPLLIDLRPGQPINLIGGGAIIGGDLQPVELKVPPLRPAEPEVGDFWGELVDGVMELFFQAEEDEDPVLVAGGDAGGAATGWTRYPFTYADFGVAHTQGNEFFLLELPAKASLVDVVMKVTEQFEIPGGFYEVSVGTAGAYTAYIGTTNVANITTGLYNNTDHGDPDFPLPRVEDWDNTTQLRVRVDTPNPDFIDDATAGALEIWIRHSPLEE